MRNNKKLILILPCYNEEENIEYASSHLTEKLNSLINENLISDDSKICFVNDGSNDNSLDKLNQLADENKRIAFINLTRNYGHQYAMYAGMKTVDADMIITLDADLQDDINAIDEMIKCYHEGYEIVYGCRNKRTTDTFFKRTTAIAFYHIIKFLCPRIYHNHADYRLMSRKALQMLGEYNEKQLFLRGLIPHLGLKSTTVLYDRKPRTAGETKYNYSSMFNLAWIGITNHSVLPLRLISLTGIFLILITLFSFFVSLIAGMKTGSYSSVLLIIQSMCLLSGLIILSIGIVAEYVAKILYEVKDRPVFQIESTKNL